MKSKVSDYISSTIYEKEVETLFKTFYHFGAHRSELFEKDSFVRISVARNSIVLWNDDGVIRAFENACPHRGCEIISEESGKAKMICPYHRWSFRKGQTFPTQKEFRSLSQEELSLTYYSIQECGDFLFFSPNPEDSLRNQLGGFYNDLEDISKSITEKIDTNNEPFNCNWKISIENALETYHVKGIHADTLNMLKLSDINTVRSVKNDFMTAQISNNKINNNLNRIKKRFEILYQNDSYFSFYLFPFGMLSSTYGLSYSYQNFFPETVDETAFMSRVYRVKTTLDSFYDGVVEINRKIFKEDSDICGAVQRSAFNHNSRFFYGVEETRILNFHNNYNNLMN